jgi:hypothetical protein
MDTKTEISRDVSHLVFQTFLSFPVINPITVSPIFPFSISPDASYQWGFVCKGSFCSQCSVNGQFLPFLDYAM